MKVYVAVRNLKHWPCPDVPFVCSTLKDCSLYLSKYNFSFKERAGALRDLETYGQCLIPIGDGGTFTIIEKQARDTA